MQLSLPTCSHSLLYLHANRNTAVVVTASSIPPGTRCVCCVRAIVRRSIAETSPITGIYLHFLKAKGNSPGNKTLIFYEIDCLPDFIICLAWLPQLAEIYILCRPYESYEDPRIFLYKFSTFSLSRYGLKALLVSCPTGPL